MGAGDFRGDAGRLDSQIEEMASVVYGMPKNEQSRKVAKETAGLLRTLSGLKFELAEEPLPPRPPQAAREGGDNG